MNIAHFNLPTQAGGQPPAFADARSCREWLAAQPLANAVQAQALLMRQINLLNRFEMAAAERLKILELLRDPAAFAQSESSRKFSGRPLPLTPPEQASLDANRALWEALQAGYLICLADLLKGNEELRAHAALVAQRVLSALRAELLDSYRASIDPPAGLWQKLHALFSVAEDWGVHTQPVSDSLQTGYSASSVASTYAHALLMNRASPFELPGRQLAQVDRWLQRWSGKVVVLTTPPEEIKVPPLCVDLASDAPECDPGQNPAKPRWLDVKDLARSVKRRIAHLQKGESPASLGLGQDCVQPACENLLRQLYRQWAKGGAPRQHTRREGAGGCLLVSGHDAIHHYVSGTKFEQPGGNAILSKSKADEIATFGRVASHHEDDYSRAHGFMIETWKVLDESATGYRLARELDLPGARLGTGQMVAIMPVGARQYLLAVARWVRLTGSGELQAGIQIMPGQPCGVSLRGTGLAAVSEKYRPGFRLLAVPALDYPESVIVPAGWFRPGRVIELFEEGSRQVRLMEQIDRGSDFERCAFDKA